jgi:hypothetical protein
LTLPRATKVSRYPVVRRPSARALATHASLPMAPLRHTEDMLPSGEDPESPSRIYACGHSRNGILWLQPPQAVRAVVEHATPASSDRLLSSPGSRTSRLRRRSREGQRGAVPARCVAPSR